MAKIKAIELSEEQRLSLEKGGRYGPSHDFRQRCHIILLKAQWLTSQVYGFDRVAVAVSF